MCIHGDKSQPERDWVLTGKNTSQTVEVRVLASLKVNFHIMHTLGLWIKMISCANADIFKLMPTADVD